jgi:hypothetical protein
MIHEQFYSELGKYLYAIAMADGGIQEQELKKLERAVSHELKLMKSKEENIKYKEVILAKLNFYNSIREHTNMNDARNSFISFIKKNSGKLDFHEKQVGLKLIRIIAEAWKGKDKTEDILVTEAEKYLK